jgi:hypothetical protein
MFIFPPTATTIQRIQIQFGRPGAYAKTFERISCRFMSIYFKCYLTLRSSLTL